MEHFSLKTSKMTHLQSMAIVIGPCRTNFCSQKLKRRILATFGIQQDGAMCHTAEATLDVLNPIFEVTVWCGFWRRGIIGTFFYENGQGEAFTFNGNRYRAMLKEFLFTKIEEKDIGNIWFSTRRSYMPHSRSYTGCFAPCF